MHQLNSENELLLLQLEDVNEMIRIREAELDDLKSTAKQAAEMQSRLDMNLLQFEQMQNNIGEKQMQVEGADLRMEELEKELFQSVKMERNYRTVLDQKASLEASLLDTNNELEAAGSLYKKLKTAKAELAAMKSQLDSSLEEIDHLKALLNEAEGLNALLKASRVKG